MTTQPPDAAVKIHMKTHIGSCLCGSVAFEIEGAFESFYLCHCGRCRKNSGSAFAANLFSSTASLRWQRGQDQVKQFDLPLTRHSRSFCSICGSPVPGLQMDGALVVVPAGSLDSDVAISPIAHIFAASRAGWDQDLEAVPSLEGLPPS